MQGGEGEGVGEGVFVDEEVGREGEVRVEVAVWGWGLETL